MFDHHLNETECFTMCDQLFIVFQNFIKHDFIKNHRTRSNREMFLSPNNVWSCWLPVIFCLDKTGFRCTYDMTPMFLAARNLLKVELSLCFFFEYHTFKFTKLSMHVKTSKRKFTPKPCLLSVLNRRTYVSFNYAVQSEFFKKMSLFNMIQNK